jgi:ornithine decarboxylase
MLERDGMSTTLCPALAVDAEVMASAAAESLPAGMKPKPLAALASLSFLDGACTLGSPTTPTSPPPPPPLAPTPTPEELVRAVGRLAAVEVRRERAPHPADVLRPMLPAAAARTPAVYAVDLGVVAARHAEFVAALPRVVPHYAVKCNPDPVVVCVLAALGANFDCASVEEIELVAGAGGVPRAELGRRVVYANPCKQRGHLKHAAAAGVELTTFDCEDELVKVREVHPRARLLLRIAVEDSSALCPLSSKYGAALTEVPALLRAARRLGLNVVGAAFHVGSGCTSVQAYVEALRGARSVFDEALRAGLPPLTVLDIGGGFPGHDGESPVTFREIARVVTRTVDALFDSSVRVIAEPGRYYVAHAFNLATLVLSRRPARAGRPCALIIGDGVYGSFKDALLLNLRFTPDGVIDGKPCWEGGGGGGGGGGQETVDAAAWGAAATLYGPTGDARDVVSRNVPIPGSVAAGDWLYFLNMGAYTVSLATAFNSTAGPERHYYIGGCVEDVTS